MKPHQQHIMQCPTCTDTALMMSDRGGVDIDHCPQCQGNRAKSELGNIFD